MKLPTSSISLAFCVLLAALGTAPSVRAAEHNPMTGTTPASAADAPGTLKFKTSEAVPAILKLHSGASAFADGYKSQLRFPGQSESVPCIVNLPKSGQKVQPGESAIVTIKCTTPWQVSGHAMSFQAFDGGHLVADGTLRP